MSVVQFDKSFAPSEATRGQWVPLDMTTLSPSYSGRGKYAVLTYNIGSELLSAVITEPISLKGVISADLIEVDNIWFTNPISAIIVNTTVPISAIIQSIAVPISAIIQSVAVPVSTISVNLNLTQVKSQTISDATSAVIDFSPPVDFVEILNNETSATRIIQLDFNTGLTFADILTAGLPIEPGTYYSIERRVPTLILTNNSGNSVDVRVFGHYRV